MTCKDCLHYSVCQYRRGREMLPTGNQCKDFTDRSEWVHLPCMVGDKVYEIEGIRIYESTCREIVISSTDTLYCTENVAFVERAIGDSIFLTREEAEKALEENK